MQKAGLCKQYEENEEFRLWLKHLMAVPMLPCDLIPVALTQLLSENVRMPTPTDRLNFFRYKRYVQKTWQIGVNPENLSVFRCKHKTTNGCESFHAKLKQWIMRHSPSFWIFVHNINRVFDFYYQQWQRMIEFGPDKLTRKKPITIKNKTHRSNAEDLLMHKDPKKRINWRQFLGLVSYTTNSLVERLQKEFTDQNGKLIDDHEIFYDANDNGENCCIKCQLRIYEKIALDCGHQNVCQVCVNNLRKDFDHPACPNIDSGEEIIRPVKLKT